MKLGRLFWKFFLIFWLAQLVTTIGVGIMIWSGRPDRPPPPYHAPPPMEAAPHPMPPPGPHHHDHPWRPPLLPIAAGGVVSLIFAAALAWYFSRPIRTLRQAFEAEAGGQLNTRVAKAMGKRRDELADLGQDFDRMAERLQSLMEGQRRLLHDVSHELRSPLARLQAACDLLQQQPERSREYIERIQRDVGRMDHLVGELLALARLDSGISQTPMECFSLPEILEEVADDARFEAEAKTCNLEFAYQPVSIREDDIAITGHLELLRRALDNVLRNAVRHAPPHSTIWVRLTRLAGQLEVTVEDAGSGVPTMDLENIFEPFYRTPNAQAFEGYGLGLTIARQVLKLHAGSITARNLHPTGFAVVLRLPLTR